MAWLLIVSTIWAFSFGLIKGRLTGIDPSLVALLRVALALAVFLPFFRPRGIKWRDAVLLVAIGAVQFGLMYICYIAAFQYLAAHEVALLTIFTPLFVSLFAQGFQRSWRTHSLLAAGIATFGAGIVVLDRPPGSFDWTGVVLMQISNAAFALGQVAWRRWKRSRPAMHDARIFALLYLGAVLVTLPSSVPVLGSVFQITPEQWLTLIYLGLIASGLGFFLWNYGAARTPAGPLAVVNNLKIPLAVACSLFFFHEEANVARLVVGGGLVVAAGVMADLRARRRPRPSAGPTGA